MRGGGRRRTSTFTAREAVTPLQTDRLATATSHVLALTLALEAAPIDTAIAKLLGGLAHDALEFLEMWAEEIEAAHKAGVAAKAPRQK